MNTPGSTVDTLDDNPDCSIKLALSDDGVVTLTWQSARGPRE